MEKGLAGSLYYMKYILYEDIVCSPNFLGKYGPSFLRHRDENKGKTKDKTLTEGKSKGKNMKTIRSDITAWGVHGSSFPRLWPGGSPFRRVRALQVFFHRWNNSAKKYLHILRSSALRIFRRSNIARVSSNTHYVNYKPAQVVCFKGLNFYEILSRFMERYSRKNRLFPSKNGIYGVKYGQFWGRNGTETSNG